MSKFELQVIESIRLFIAIYIHTRQKFWEKTYKWNAEVCEWQKVPTGIKLSGNGVTSVMTPFVTRWPWKSGNFGNGNTSMIHLVQGRMRMR